MKISGFSYIRNGFKYGYPFMESMQSILPICDEFVMAVGESQDGTREAIMALNNPKIKIIDTVWDETMRTSGKIFAQQANIALKQITGDWGFHIQADEIIHEQDLDKIYNSISQVNEKKHIEGLLFDFLNFYGSYNYLNDTRFQHKKEIRVIRNMPSIFSYRDSQGFRKYNSEDDYNNGAKGEKLNVKYIEVPVYHYNYVRDPKIMEEKMKKFDSYWNDDNALEQKHKNVVNYDFQNIERIKRFEGTHPKLIQANVNKEDWKFDPKSVNRKLSPKVKIVYWLEDLLGFQLGEYKNYKIVE